MVKEPYFKDWAIPGPQLVPQSTLIATEDETLDALSGHFRIFQLKKGHRFSTDDILTAWYGTSWCPRADRVLDLGSGIGSVGMVAAWRLPGARFVTVEAQEASVALARKSASYNQLESRYEIRQGDFRDASILKENEKFDLVLGSPPYFPLTSGIVSEHPQKLACRFEMRGDISDYCNTAAKHLNHGGVFACIFPIQPLLQLTRVQKASAAAGLSIVRTRSIVLKEGEASLLSLFLMMRSEHLPEKFRKKTWIEPPLIIRALDGSIHPEYSALKLSFGFPPY